MLDPIDIYDKGLRDLDSLAGVERLIFIRQDFDDLMEMEGWDHFFLYKHHFTWYPEMREWLRAIGDSASLTVLDNYEAHLKANGVALSSLEIEEFLDSQDDSYWKSCPDWCGQFCELREVRWEKAIAYIEGQGMRVQTAQPKVAEFV